MLLRASLLLLVILITPTTACSAGQGGAARHAAVDVDHDYLLALHTANRFLGAWLEREPAAGAGLLTDELRRNLRDGELAAYFTGDAGSRPFAFELTGGELISPDTMAFRVWLYAYDPAETPTPQPRAWPTALVLVRVEADRWAVAGLPPLTDRGP